MEVAQPLVVDLQFRLTQSPELLHAMKSGMSDTSASVVEKRIMSAFIKRSVAGLDSSKKAELLSIKQQLAALGSTFGHHRLDSCKAWKRTITAQQATGMPPDLLVPEGNGYQLTLSAPVVVAALKHLQDCSLREEVYIAYNNIAAAAPFDNTPGISRILELRARMAAIKSFATYADMELANKMAGTAAAVQDLIDQLSGCAMHTPNPIFSFLCHTRSL